MSTSAPVVFDLFRSPTPGAPAKRRGPKPNGFAAALAVIVSHGRQAAARSSVSVSAPTGLSAPRALADEGHRSSTVRGAPQLSLVREPPKVAATRDDGERATCPKCGHEGPVHADFGLRKVRGGLRAQSWCRPCRARRAGEQERALHSVGEVAALADLPLWAGVH